MRVITFYRLMVLLCAFLAAYAFLPTTSSANPAQKHICHVGGALGTAEATLTIFGREFGDAIPPEQIGLIADNLKFASEQIVAADALFGEPIKTYRARNKLDANVQTKLAGYASKTSGSSYQNKASYIKNIVDSYRSSLARTYVRSRPDDIRYNPNCDSKIFMACYHYARAQLASGGDSSFANSYKWTATQEFRNTVGAGLEVAMDSGVVAGDPGHSPWEGHGQKICCTFGTPMDWEAMQLGRFAGTSPAAWYVGQMPILVGIINDATALDQVCKSDDSYYSASSKVGSGRFAGKWYCDVGEGANLTLVQNGNEISGSWGNEEGSVPINGNANANNIKFGWQYSGSSGKFDAKLSANGNSINGTWEGFLPGWGQLSEPFSCNRQR